MGPAGGGPPASVDSPASGSSVAPRGFWAFVRSGGMKEDERQIIFLEPSAVA